jgi:hypothetical protein
MKDLQKRVVQLEGDDRPKLRVCWLGNEPDRLAPGEQLLVVSWECEERK